MRRLSRFEQLVLLAVARSSEAAYGMELREEIRRRTDEAVSLAAVYAALGRLEESGLVSSWIAPPTARRGGRATKHFVLEPAGARALQAAQTAMGRMWEGVDLSPYLERR